MRDIQSLVTEMFCDSGNQSPTIMNDIFTQKGNNQYNVRQVSKLSKR